MHRAQGRNREGRITVLYPAGGSRELKTDELHSDWSNQEVTAPLLICLCVLLQVYLALTVSTN